MGKVLITGGTGFIGRHLIPLLKEDGWGIEVLTRSAERARQVLPSDVEVTEDLTSAQQPSAIINLAGENLSARRWTQSQKNELRESRLRITRSLLEFIDNCEQPPEVLISGSAVGYYGARGDERLTEPSVAGNEFQAQLCIDWENEALKAQSRHDMRVCLLRTGIVLDKKEGALAQMLPPFRMGAGGRFGTGHQYMSWIHVRDHVRAIRFLLTNSALHGPFNLTAPRPVTNQTFTRVLGQVLGRPTFFRMPASLLKLILGEMARLLLTGQQVIPEALCEAGYDFEFSSLEQALEDLLSQEDG